MCGQQDEDDTPTVTFPDDYPNSVRHFLLIGFLGMFIGAIVFFYMGISRKVNTVMHVLTFFIAAVSACAYYAEWAGLGVEYKTTDTTPRVIFWAHYLDWVVTGPVRSTCPYACCKRTSRRAVVGRSCKQWCLGGRWIDRIRALVWGDGEGALGALMWSSMSPFLAREVQDINSFLKLGCRVRVLKFNRK